MSRSVQPVMFADLHVVFRFEPVDGKITVIYCTGKEYLYLYMYSSN